MARLMDQQIWSPTAQADIPLSQVAPKIEPSSRTRSSSTRPETDAYDFADPVEGVASALRTPAAADPSDSSCLALINLSGAASMRTRARPRAALAAQLPTFLILMVLTTIALFNNLRQPLVIWLCVPLAMIGVTLGLLVTGQPFGFMAPCLACSA